MAKPSPGDKVTRILEAMQSSKELQNAIVVSSPLTSAKFW